MTSSSPHLGEGACQGGGKTEGTYVLSISSRAGCEGIDDACAVDAMVTGSQSQERRSGMKFGWDKEGYARLGVEEVYRRTAEIALSAQPERGVDKCEIYGKQREKRNSRCNSPA